MAKISSMDDYRHHKTGQPVKSAIEQLLADARLRLVETGTRNRLVHTPRGGKRTRSLPISGAEADSLMETLLRPGGSLRFQPANGSPSAPRPGGGTVFLRTNLAEEALAKRLLTI